MANNLSNYSESGLLEHMFRNVSISKPTMWLALTSKVAVEGDTGSSLPEIAHGNGYARQVVTGNGMWTPWFDYNGSGAIQNIQNIAFSQNVTTDWGWVSGIAILDASGDALGNVWWYGPLSTAKLITVGDSFSIPSGSATILMG